jgi:hypothetical protein
MREEKLAEKDGSYQKEREGRMNTNRGFDCKRRTNRFSSEREKTT